MKLIIIIIGILVKAIVKMKCDQLHPAENITSSTEHTISTTTAPATVATSTTVTSLPVSSTESNVANRTTAPSSLQTGQAISTTTKPPATEATSTTVTSLLTSPTESIVANSITAPSSIQTGQDEPCKSDNEGIYLPIYSIFLMGLSIFIMSLVILCLAMVLYKRKLYEYKVFNKEDVPATSTFDRGVLKRQTSKQEANQMSSISALKNGCDDYPEYLKPICHRTNDEILATVSNQNNLTIPPKIKKGIPTNVILPEQMRQICKDVLSKRPITNSISSKYLNEMLNAINSGEPTPTSVERSASTPDFLDVYDNPRQLNDNFKSELPAQVTNVSTHETKMEVYDYVPTIHNNPAVVIDDQYRFPMKPETVLINEPSYINANRQFLL